jgi:hypothetical protein
MTDEHENQNEEQEHKPVAEGGFNKTLAILFVLSIYLVIFLKILFIK